MSKHGTIEFSGKSGKLYSFNVYSLDTEFRPYSGVYCITRRSEGDNGHRIHEKLFISVTDDMSSGVLSETPKSCFENHSANCICTHREESAHARDEIMQDLVGHYNPPCN